MAGLQEQLEIRFRLHDGSDIGPRRFSAATSVATVKESILAEWPKEKVNGPRTVGDVKLINAGKILENNRTLGECKSPLVDVAGGVTTMHVVVQSSLTDKGNGAVVVSCKLGSSNQDNGYICKSKMESWSIATEPVQVDGIPSPTNIWSFFWCIMCWIGLLRCQTSTC